MEASSGGYQRGKEPPTHPHPLASPIERKPRLAGRVKETSRRLGPNDNLHKPLLKTLIGEGEGVKQHAVRPTDQKMPSSLFCGVRSIIRKKARGGGVKTHNVTQQAKGLEGRPGVWVNLGGSHIECLKDAHCKLIEGEGDMKVREKTGVHVKEGGTGSRSPQAHTLGGLAG